MSVGSSNGTRRLGDGLGWFNLDLGSAQLVEPGVMNRLVGADDDAVSRAVQRWLGGAREVAVGVGIELRRRPVEWLWARSARVRQLRRRCERLVRSAGAFAGLP